MLIIKILLAYVNKAFSFLLVPRRETAAKLLFMAPDAPGVPLAECPTADCQQMQVQIGEMLGAGATREEIIAYFTGIYGLEILASPPAEGFFLLIWIIPLLALAVGAYLTYFYTQRIKKGRV